MKKLNRKLIPAFAMLLLSAVLMSTASFAWFTSNGSVAADGINITATAPAALWIADESTDAFDTAVTLKAATAAKTGMYPVTQKPDTNTKDNDQWNFWRLKSDSYSKITDQGVIEGGINYDTDLEAAKDGDFIKEDIYLKLEGTKVVTDGELDEEKSEIMKIGVKVQITEPTNAVGDVDLIYKSIKIAVVTSANTSEKETGATTDICSTNGSYVFQPKNFEQTAAQYLFDLVAQETVKVTIYVWFEGEDEFCKNANAMDLESFGIELAFEEYVPAQNQG